MATIKSLRVAVIGGAGLFGSRLCAMLVRDGHRVCVVGRSAHSGQVAAQLDCDTLRMDRAGDLAPLWAWTPDVVVDAAGPFQTYGADPLRLPRACIAQGVDYFDLSDVTAFCGQVASLDAAAKAAGVRVWSGLSTVPCLSTAFVAHMIQDMQPVAADIAILPGNRTPRGRSVTHSIMAQAGTRFDLTEGGQTVGARNWSRARWFDLPQGHRRKARLFDLPDQATMPGAPPQGLGIPTVRTWASLEYGLLDFGLLCFATARRFGLPFFSWMVGATLAVARLFERVGTDVGGMGVEVTGWQGDTAVVKSANFIVERGQGPCVPGVPVRAALRDLDQIPCGAGVAAGLLDRARLLAAMDDLPLVLEDQVRAFQPLFPRVIGSDFAALPPAVQRSHQTIGVHHFKGVSKVIRGRGLWPRIIARVFGFPPAADAVDVTVTKRTTPTGEVWTRVFGGSEFRSDLTARGGKMHERFGPFRFELGLAVRGGTLQFPVNRGWLGPLPLPKILLPTSDATESETGGNLRFDVKLLAPITKGLIVWYQGELRPVTGQDS